MRTVDTQIALERKVIGALLTKGDLYWELPAGFRGDVFRATPGLSTAFEAVRRLAEEKTLGAGRVDVRHLASASRLPDEIASDLEAIQREAEVDAAALPGLAAGLMDSYRRVTLARLLSQSQSALAGDQPTLEITGKLLTELLDLGKGDRPEVVSFREATLNTLDFVERQKTGKTSVLKSGIQDLDNILHIRKGNLIVLGARPGIGKTTLALNIADNVALNTGPVLVHSLEMSDSELCTLALSRAAEIDSETFFDEKGWPQAQWDRLGAAVEKRVGKGEGRMWINDAHHSLGAICRITEKMHRKHGLSLVVLDYLQLVQVDLGKGANREQQIATIARTLKLMAMRLQIPVLALSQLNRAPEQRNQGSALPRCAKCGDTQNRHQGKHWDGHPFEKPLLQCPKLHDLRESGAIEQDANAVLFLHNPYAESDDPVKRKRGPYELVVAKQRLGRKGKLYLWGDLEYARFRPYSRAVEAEAGHWNDKESA